MVYIDRVGHSIGLPFGPRLDTGAVRQTAVVWVEPRVLESHSWLSKLLVHLLRWPRVDFWQKCGAVKQTELSNVWGWGDIKQKQNKK